MCAEVRRLDVQLSLSLLVSSQTPPFARDHMARERHGHTLQPTALVNETRMRLVDLERHRSGVGVLARPDTGSYRASNFVRRHRGLVAGVARALVTAALVGEAVRVLGQRAAAAGERALAVMERWTLPEDPLLLDTRVNTVGPCTCPAGVRLGLPSWKRSCQPWSSLWAAPVGRCSSPGPIARRHS